MKMLLVLAGVVTCLSAVPQAVEAQGQASAVDVSAVQAKIDAEDAAVGQAIANHDFAALNRYWSPLLVVDSPANQIVSRAQVIESMQHGGLDYTSLKGTPEFFTVTGGVAIKMMREDVVMASGPMAGKHLVRRSTNILQRSGDDWVLIARQATYVGFDGAILAGPVTTTYIPAPETAETTAAHGQIEANGRAVGRAIRTMDFASLGKLWSPALVVNSPGNNILTREQVFASMREGKLTYSSAKVFPDVFFVSGDVAVQMGHEELMMANGPMAGQPLKRRYTDVWQKSGDGWVMIARQATYVGIDGGAAYGHPDPSLNR